MSDRETTLNIFESHAKEIQALYLEGYDVDMLYSNWLLDAETIDECIVSGITAMGLIDKLTTDDIEVVRDGMFNLFTLALRVGLQARDDVSKALWQVAIEARSVANKIERNEIHPKDNPDCIWSFESGYPAEFSALCHALNDNLILNDPEDRTGGFEIPLGANEETIARIEAEQWKRYDEQKIRQEENRKEFKDFLDGN